MKKTFILSIVLLLAASMAWAAPPFVTGGGGASTAAEVVAVFGSGSCSGYLKSDGTCDTPSGAGDVSKVGTPTNHQWGYWTGDGTLAGATVTASKVVCSNSNGDPVACTNLTDVAFSGYVPTSWITRAGTNNVLTYTGDYSLGLTLTGNTSVTLPTSGTLATTALKPSDLAISSQAAGDVIYFNGTNWVRLAKDTGKYLKSGDSAVSWDTPTGAAHDAVSLAASATPILGLSTQELSFDTQTANYVLAGPTTGAAAAPTFRALVAADIPDISATYIPKSLLTEQGDIIYASAAGTPAALAHGSANAPLLSGGNGANPAWAAYTIAAPDAAGAVLYSDGTNWTRATTLSVTLNNAAAQFVDQSAATKKILIDPSGNTAGATTTIKTNQAADATLNIGAITTGDYVAVGPAQVRFTGPTAARAKAVSDAADTIAEVGQNNTFTGTNVFNGATTIGDAGDDIVVNLNVNASDATYSGLTITRTVKTGSAAEAFGQCMFVNSSGELEAADADASTSMPCVCILVTAGEGASKKCVINGTVTETDWNWTVGGLLYVGTDPATTTGLTQTAPSGTGDQVQVVGVALSADTILFQPSLVLVEIK